MHFSISCLWWHIVMYYKNHNLGCRTKVQSMADSQKVSLLQFSMGNVEPFSWRTHTPEVFHTFHVLQDRGSRSKNELFAFVPINNSPFVIWRWGAWKNGVLLLTWLDLILMNRHVKVELGYMLMTISNPNQLIVLI